VNLKTRDREEIMKRFFDKNLVVLLTRDHLVRGGSCLQGDMFTTFIITLHLVFGLHTKMDLFTTSRFLTTS
jgi:hypothetical protein